MGQLSNVVQAVEFEITVKGIGAVRCLISAEALQERFGAGDAPGSWLLAYEQHRTEIEKAARSTWRTSTVMVILTENSFEMTP